MRGYIPPQNEKETLFYRHIQDIVRRVSARKTTSFTLFLNERERDLAEAALSLDRSLTVSLYGGYHSADRLMMGISSDGEIKNDKFPVSAVRIFCKGAKNLTHRDFLGSIMALGISRESVGDIIQIDDETALCYFTNIAADVCMRELISVGRFHATAEIAITDSQSQMKKIPSSRKCFFSSSLRADAVLAGILKKGRSESQNILKKGFVQINHMLITDSSFSVQNEDMFSIRGYGKYQIFYTGNLSKKGRLCIEWIQF